MNKRKLMQVDIGLRKRQCEETPVTSKRYKPPNSELLPLLEQLKSTFRLDSDIPPIVFVHQLYDLIQCRTTVDRKIDMLREDGTIRVFKTNLDSCSLAVVLTKDLVEFLNKIYPSRPSIKRFINLIIPEVNDVVVEKSVLRGKFKFTDREISDLVNAGLISVRCASSYWFSLPSFAHFVKVFVKGRRSILQTIRKCKYSEILITELERRNLKKTVTLSIKYHIHDIIGADLVKCIETSSGTVVRFYRMPSLTTKRNK